MVDWSNIERCNSLPKKMQRIIMAARSKMLTKMMTAL
jgi:hypothetical protein